MKLLKDERVIREIKFKSFGNKNGRDNITLTNKRVALKSVAKGRAKRKTEKHFSLSDVSGISITNEKHFNWKAFGIWMLVPLAAIGYAYWQSFYFQYVVGGAIALIILGVLVFRKSYFHIEFLGIVDSQKDGASVQVTGRTFKDKRNEIENLKDELMILITGGELVVPKVEKVVEEVVAQEEKEEETE